MAVVAQSVPPKRLEGGGFEIMDLLSGFNYRETDPFVLWHELPRKTMPRGSFPGANLHSHRGFCEIPYCKTLTNEGIFRGRMIAGGEERWANITQGDLEFGLCGAGVEHDGLLDNKWTGDIHFFQLWLNLPAAHKMDPPWVQNCRSHRMPTVQLSPDARAKVLIGSFRGATSPVESPYTKVLYMDVEIGSSQAIELDVGNSLPTKWIDVYKGRGSFGGTPVRAGEVYHIKGDVLNVEVEEGSMGLMILQGTPIGEPCVHYGPFVMSTEAEIRRALQDRQEGKLCFKKPKFELIE